MVTIVRPMSGGTSMWSSLHSPCPLMTFPLGGIPIGCQCLITQVQCQGARWLADDLVTRQGAVLSRAASAAICWGLAFDGFVCFAASIIILPLCQLPVALKFGLVFFKSRHSVSYSWCSVKCMLSVVECCFWLLGCFWLLKLNGVFVKCFEAITSAVRES